MKLMHLEIILIIARQEYFRKLLYNHFGEEIEDSELPDDIAWLVKVSGNLF
jgi:glucuronate isomerase